MSNRVQDKGAKIIMNTIIEECKKEKRTKKQRVYCGRYE